MMLKVFYLYLCVITNISIPNIAGMGTSTRPTCPLICTCLDNFVDCSNRGINGNLPFNIPLWVKSLDVSENELKGANISEYLSTFKDISELKLGRNSLTAIPISHSLKDLTILSVTHNKLNENSFAVLRHLPRLRELDLSSNLISHISVGLVPNSTALRNLNLNYNKIYNIEKGSLEPISKLVELKLARNHLRQLNKDVFRNLTSLKSLDLSRNRFSTVEGLSFTGLKSLNTLKLKGNSIQKLEDGAFFGLDGLTSLYLDSNSIGEVTKGCLYGLNSLHQLFLSHNKILALDAVWEFCPQLRELDVSYNLLKGIEKDTLQHLGRLEILKLDNNHISYIAEGAFNHTPMLTELDLNGNKISWTIEDMQGPFVGLKLLTKLGLANNLITSVSEQALMGLVSLLYLDLSGNQIKTMHAHTLNHTPLLHGLQLNSTSLVCDCSLAWLPLFVHSTDMITTEMYCAYPSHLSGVGVSTLPADQFLCSPDDYPKPVIVEEPKTQVALSGSNVSLVCKAVSSSSAPMSFKWRRNNRDMTAAEVSITHELTGNTHLSQLTLINVTVEASALYQCIVSNDFGPTYSHKANLSVYTFPELLKTPSNVTTKAGSMARLECAASGHPSPQIGWQKDGGTDFPAAQERRVHVMPTDDVFFIVNVKPVDSGVYSCTAQNIAGMAVANATLNVVEPPSFVKKMENKEVKAGEAIVLECMASGSPKPTLRWTKNGGPLQVTDRHFFTAEDQLLIIMDTVIGDSGLYCCEMNNSLGTNKGQAHLTVIPLYDGSVTEEDMTGVIIITVVCCAVGTSIVWVIIIYQTRKRLNPPSPTQPTVVPAKGFHSDNKSEHSSSSKDSGTGDSTKRSHEDLLLDTVTCTHQEGELSGPEVTLPLLTSFHPYGETKTSVYKVPCCCKPGEHIHAPARTDHDRQHTAPGYLCVPFYLPSSPTNSTSSNIATHSV